MVLKRTLSIFLAVLMIGMTFTALPITVNAADVDTAGTAVDKTFTIETADDLSAAVSEINAVTTESNYVIDLRTDLNDCGIAIQNEAKVKVTVTIIGNGHTLSTTTHTLVYVDNGATVNIGDGESALTIQGDDLLHPEIGNDDHGLVYVLSDSTCNMRDKVTLKDRRGDNCFGGGVSVQGGTFIMDGGTIEHCGVASGSVCFGGGVAVYAGGTFIMNGGTIDRCYVNANYSYTWDDYYASDGNIYPGRTLTACGAGVFVTSYSNFTMNGGAITNNSATTIDNKSYGGGVALVIDTNEMADYGMGYPKSAVSINGGTISGNFANFGAGVLATGYNEAYAVPIGSVEGDAVLNPGLFINGTKTTNNGVTSSSVNISNNTATAGRGGGIMVAALRNTVACQIYNADIIDNTAKDGAGIISYSYWTKMYIDGCFISGNTASGYGGGVCAYLTGGSGIKGESFLKDTTVTNNKAYGFGAGVIYLNSASNPSKLNISGKNIIQDNYLVSDENGEEYFYKNNLCVDSTDYPVYVNGDLTGSQIGLSDPTLWDDDLPDEDAQAVSTEYLTSGYKEHNPKVHPSEYFTSDHETWIVDRSEQTKEETVDPSSVTYREYTVNRYPYIPASDPKLNPLYGQNNEYVYSEIKNPDIDKISSFNDLYNEMKYKYSDTSKYTKITDVNNNGNIYLKYSILDSTYPTTLTIQKTSSNNYATVTFSQSPITGKGGSIVFRVYLNDQTLYADTKELVYKVYDTTNYISNSNYSYAFSEDYTTKSIKYVNTNPPADTIYEYDDYGNLTAKLEIVGGVSNYTLKQKTTEIITGNTNEVRLVRADINYHINNDVIDDKYDNNDIFTHYVEEATGKDVKVGETIDSFYLIPEVVPTQQNSCPYIFKGWYYDQDNENDTRPVKFGTDKYAKDIYAHWIKVENVTKDENDESILPTEDNDQYGGFDLAGVQIRKEMRDYNFDNVPKMPGGMRFVTSLSMDVVNEINKIKPNNIEYGYVAATHEGWIDYHAKGNNEKLQYVSTSANGIDTSSANAKNEDYYGFAHNVKCTSRVANSQNNEVRVDHQNFGDYLLYSFVVTYEGDDAARKDTNVLARPYIHYTDANGLERVAYSEYTGASNVLGGCYTNYNTVAAMAGN